MSDMAKEMGRLQSDSENTKEQIASLFKSNTKRKDAINKTNTDFLTILHTVEESNVSINTVVGAMEEIKQSLVKIEDKIESNDAAMSVRVEALEKRIFDWPEFLRGLITAKGILLVTIACATISTIVLALAAPEHLPEFFATVKATKE